MSFSACREPPGPRARSAWRAERLGGRPSPPPLATAPCWPIQRDTAGAAPASLRAAGRRPRRPLPSGDPTPRRSRARREWRRARDLRSRARRSQWHGIPGSKALNSELLLLLPPLRSPRQLGAAVLAAAAAAAAPLVRVVRRHRAAGQQLAWKLTHRARVLQALRRELEGGAKVEGCDGRLVQRGGRVVHLGPHLRVGHTLRDAVLEEGDARARRRHARPLLLDDELLPLDEDALPLGDRAGRVAHLQVAADHVARPVLLAVPLPHRLVELCAPPVSVAVRVCVEADRRL
mmetsp:Transcript_17316/g.56676  ORF Transcript_17316/g.56676 Transcript_17316/m.56676 type:complete len:290 (-) Transcript_17316:1059-1928(-)